MTRSPNHVPAARLRPDSLIYVPGGVRPTGFARPIAEAPAARLQTMIDALKQSEGALRRARA